MEMHSTNVGNKYRLPEAIAYKMGCKGGRIYSYSTLTWTIPMPFNLKNGVLYGKEKSGAVVTLVRNRNSFTLSFTSKHYSHSLRCFVFLDETRKPKYFEPYESPKGVFTIQCGDLLRDSRNTLLKELGILAVKFEFGLRHGRMTRICPTTGIWNSLNRDRKFIESTEKVTHIGYTDFAFKIKEELFNAHKALIAARGPYFRFFVKETCASEMIFRNTTCKTLNTMIKYLYTGTVTMRFTDDVIRIVELAAELDLLGLVELCVLWLEDKFNESNVGRIREVAVKHGIQDLVQLADSFLRMPSNEP